MWFTYHSGNKMLPEDFQMELLSFRILNVLTSPGDSTLTTLVNPANLINVLYMTFILEQTCCPAFQTPWRHHAILFIHQEWTQIPVLADLQEAHMFSVSERKFRRQPLECISAILLLDKHQFQDALQKWWLMTVRCLTGHNKKTSLNLSNWPSQFCFISEHDAGLFCANSLHATLYSGNPAPDFCFKSNSHESEITTVMHGCSQVSNLIS